MSIVYHSSDSRGQANHGWLKSYHTFSFANYKNPDRMNFGLLRVINDDIIEPAMGFDTHPHKDMEIISIPILGSLKHKDTLGNSSIITKGEVQTMSAGTGIAHSEYNASTDELTNLLQIWVMPKEINITPQYSQKKFDLKDRINKWQLVVSPDGRDESAQINQDAYFSLAQVNESSGLIYQKFKSANGIYIFIISGEVQVLGQKLERRDGMGITGENTIELVSLGDAEVLLMEIPMD